MPDTGLLIALTINGVNVRVTPGTTVAAAVLMTSAGTRTSAGGDSRGPLCGMGICFECRVTIDGASHQRSCQVLCTSGMRVATP